MTSSKNSHWTETPISTHILTKRMTVGLNPSAFFALFQLTSSRRGWPPTAKDWIRYILFQLTSSRRGWPYVQVARMSPSLFQLTSSRRGWQAVLSRLLSSYHFNSHPHKEDDLKELEKDNASIHFNSHPHKEDDGRSDRSTTHAGNFNSHPHKEDDESFFGISKSPTKFQLTSSQGGWQCPVKSSGLSILFQLTSSQGGWRRHGQHHHKGMDISTHILTRRMTSSASASRPVA